MRYVEPLIAVMLACGPGAPPDEGPPEDHAAPEAPASRPDTSVVSEAEASGPVERVRPDTSASADTASRATAGGSAAPRRSTLERYDFDVGRRFDLPGRLDEISGLAFSPDGRLFAHDDERGRIHEIDPRTGDVGKSFDLGDDLARDDFEGIAIVDERFFLVASSGLLYESREGADEEEVRYLRTDTRVGFDCEVEGLEHDPVDDALLLACKVSTSRQQIVIHRIPIAPEAERLQPIRVDRGELSAFDLDADFQPSGVAVGPDSTILLVSAATEAVLEIDRSGRVIAGVALSRRRHPQPEGLEVGPDGTLYIADEESSDDARLTAYAPTRSDGR